MNAIKLVDSKLGPDFLINKQVTCEVLFLPFAQETEDGKLKFVGIHYDKLPKGVQLALVPFHAVEADSGEPVEDPKFIDSLLSVGNQGSVMFINNRLTQDEGLDVTEIINVLDNIDELKQIVSDTAGKRDRASIQLKKEVEEKLLPIKEKLEQAIIKDPNIIGKDMLGKDYEGIVINSRLGPIKVTSQEQRDVISAKLDAKKNARTERDRDNQNKTAVVAIGSFVGHKGHQQLFDYTIKRAAELGGDPYLFMGNAVGKDDPIPVADKVKTWQLLYPQYSKNVSAVTMEGGSLMQKIKHELINPLPGKPPRYDNIVIMVGEDQAKMPIATALMKAVNKFPGYEHVKAQLEATPRGTGMSFTKLRNVLKDGNPNEQYTMWNDAFNGGEYGAKQLPPEWIKHLMDVTKKGMNIKTPSVTAPIKKQEQPAMAKPQPPVPQQPEQEPISESLKREIMIKRAEIAWLKESQNASQMAGPSGPEYDKTGGHHSLGENLLDNVRRTQIIHYLAKKMDWEVNYLELATDHELIKWYKKVQAGQDPMKEGWKSKLAGAAMSGAMALGGGSAHAGDDTANAGWHNLPDIVAHITMNVNGKTIEKDINLGTEYQSPAEAQKAVAKWLADKGIKNYKIDLERVKSDSNEAANPAQQAAIAIAKKKKKGIGEVFDGDKETGTTHKGGNVEKTKHGIRHTKTDYDDGNGEKGRKPSEKGPSNRYHKTPILDKEVDEAKQRLDPKCWTGYRKSGTKMKGGKRVNNCVKIGEGWENEIGKLIKLLESK